MLTRYRFSYDLTNPIPADLKGKGLSFSLIMSRIMPKGYRIAYIDPVTRTAVCYPFGLHWLVRAWRRLWEHSLRYRMNTYEQMFDEAADIRAHQFLNNVLRKYGIRPEERN